MPPKRKEAPTWRGELSASEVFIMCTGFLEMADVVGTGWEEQLAAAQGGKVFNEGQEVGAYDAARRADEPTRRAVSRTLDPHPKLTLKVVGGQSLAAPLVVQRN